MARIFISHSSRNNAEAIALQSWLLEQGWDDVFLDLDPKRGLVAGDRWQSALKAASERCELVLFLITPDWVQSRWCLAEFLLAKQLNKRIFGIVVGKTPFEALPVEMVSEWQLVDLTVGANPIVWTVSPPPDGTPVEVTYTEDGLMRLRHGLSRAGLDAKHFPWPPEHDPNRGAYRGLKPLEAEDAGIFFGRDAPIVEVLDRLRGMRDSGAPRMLVILGASGAGKSSFLRAGLLPRLTRDDRFFVPLPVIRPDRFVISGENGLIACLETALRAAGKAQTKSALRECIAAGAKGARPVLQAISDAALAKLMPGPGGQQPAPPTLVLSIDQGEELFLAEGGKEAAPFLELLADLALTDGPALIVLVTIRSDAFERLQTAPALEGLQQKTLSLPPLPRGSFADVILGPARRLEGTPRALKIEPALVDKLLADIEEGSAKDALPLLAFTLERLYVEHGGDGDLRLSEYEALGGVRGSIEAAVEHALDNAVRDPSVSKDSAQRLTHLRHGLIPWLAGIDPDTRLPRRRVARLSEIPLESRPLIQCLVEERLLSTDTIKETNEVTIEAAHEALLRQWGVLQGWLEEDSEALANLEGVKRASREWSTKGQVGEWLLHSGGRLSNAMLLYARNDLARHLTPTDRAYLEACQTNEVAIRQEREAQFLAREKAQRSARRALFALLGLALCAIGLGAYLIGTAAERRAQVMASLASRESENGYHDRALRIAVHGLPAESDLTWLTPRVPALEGRLIGAAVASRLHSQLRGHTGSISSASFSPDGNRAVSTSIDGTVRLWNMENGELVKSLSSFSGRPARTWATFNGTGDRLLSLSVVEEWGRPAIYSIQLWDGRSGQLIATLTGHSAAVLDGQFNPAGTVIVTRSSDRTVRLWNSVDGQPIGVLRGHTGPIYDANIATDGTRILTRSHDKTARLWDGATGGLIAVLGGHEGPVWGSTLNVVARRVVTHSSDPTARLWDLHNGTAITVLRGHNGPIKNMAFSPDGERILTGSEDKTARLWAASDGREIAVLRGHTGTVLFVRFNSDGSRIVTLSTDGGARVWNGRTGAEIANLAGHQGEIFSVDFNNDGSRILTRGTDRIVGLFEGHTGANITMLRGHSLGIYTARFNTDGSRIVTASDDGTARLWDARQGAEIGTLKGHSRPVLDAHFSNDGSKILTRSTDLTIRIWNVDQGGNTATLQEHAAWVNDANVSPDGTRVLTRSSDRTARLWDSASGNRIAILTSSDRTILSAVFNADGSRIMTRSADETVRLWDGMAGHLTSVLTGHTGWVIDAIFSSDGKRALTSSSDGSARIWDSATGKQQALLAGHDGHVLSAAFSPNGQLVLTRASDRKARLFNALDGKLAAVLDGHSGDVTGAIFSPDGTRVATRALDKTARLWDSQTGKQIAEMRDAKGTMMDLIFSADGSRLVTSSDQGIVQLWDGATGAAISVLGGHKFRTFAIFNADGSRLLTYSQDESVKLWNGQDGQEIAVLRGHTGRVWAAEFSKDGSSILTSSSDKTARLWHGRTGAELATLSGHTGWMWATFSPDSILIVSHSSDATLRIWDGRRGQELAVLRGHLGEVLGAKFFSDGKRLLSRSADTTVRIWDVSWATKSSGPELRNLVCAHKLRGARTFSIEDTNDPILTGLADVDPCARLGPLSSSYWLQLLTQAWSSTWSSTVGVGQKDAAAN